MKREYYSDSIARFLQSSTEEILGKLALSNDFALIQTQRGAWVSEISILRKVLEPYSGSIYFEYSIPRMGRRIDVVLLIKSVIFVVEFKVGEKEFTSYAIDQVWDYALDLKNFHESSHEQFIAPILIATEAKHADPVIVVTPQNDKLMLPIKTDIAQLGSVIEVVLNFADGNVIDRTQWENGRYCPTQLSLKPQWRYTITILLPIFHEVMPVPSTSARHLRQLPTLSASQGSAHTSLSAS